MVVTSTPDQFDAWITALQGTAKVKDFLQIVGRDLLRSEILKSSARGAYLRHSLCTAVHRIAR